MKFEICFICDERTGRAGKGEDSLYGLDDSGPYCEECYKEAPFQLVEEYVIEYEDGCQWTCRHGSKEKE